MPDIPISQLPEVTTPAATDVIPIVNGTTTKKVQVANLYAASSGSSLVGFLQAGTGAVARTVQSKFQDLPSVTDYGASTSNTAAQNTTAFNAAIAANSVIELPAGTFDLNALTPVTSSKIIFGQGRATVLRFNTTGDCISSAPTSSPAQSRNLTVMGVAFKNITNVPACFIKSDYQSVNTLIERCYFSECAATYCVDNLSGYGCKIRNCVFSDVTGTAIRFRDELNQVTEYSFSALVDGCDIARCSADGILIEGAQVMRIASTTVQGCTGKGIVTKALTNQAGAFNLHLDAVYFEGNTGTDLDFSDCNNTYWTEAVLTACNFTGTPTIDLGSRSEVTLVHCFPTTNPTTIAGSSNAYANLIDCTNFSQSGTFAWSQNNKTFSYTATVAGIPLTSQNVQYVRNGNLVTVTGHLVISGAATGVIKISLPFASAATPAAGTIGTATGTSTGVKYAGGNVWLFDANNIEIHALDASGNEWGNGGGGSPFVWKGTDILDFTATYFASSP